MSETKKQAQGDHQGRSQPLRHCFYVNQRWLGGMLTNFKTIRKRVLRLKELEKMSSRRGAMEVLPKKEVARLLNEKRAFGTRFLGGIKDMERLPGAVSVVDPRKEKIAVAEARNLNIPVVAIVDTNCDPDEIEITLSPAMTMPSGP